MRVNRSSCSPPADPSPSGSSPAVVGRAVRRPPDPAGRLPGRDAGPAEGPAVPANHQLLRQGQGETHYPATVNTYYIIDHMGRVHIGM